MLLLRVGAQSWGCVLPFIAHTRKLEQIMGGGFALRNSCPGPPVLRCETQHLCKPNLLLFSAPFSGQPQPQSLLNPTKAPLALLPFSNILAKHHRELCWLLWLKMGKVHLVHVAAVCPCSDSTAQAHRAQSLHWALWAVNMSREIFYPCQCSQQTATL